MESRLSARLAAVAPSVSAPAREAAEAPVEIPEEATVAAVVAPPADTDEPPMPGEEAERAMLAELRERGEAPVRAKAVSADADEKPVRLPPLDELVKRIPPNVRDALDELFRARFTGVRKIPADALKTPPV
ncbi:hypothetical protein MASR2M8_06670 [Opitutaceae bacterium]